MLKNMKSPVKGAFHVSIRKCANIGSLVHHMLVDAYSLGFNQFNLCIIKDDTAANHILQTGISQYHIFTNTRLKYPLNYFYQSSPSLGHAN